MKFDVDLSSTQRSLKNKDLATYISSQLNFLFPDNKPVSTNEVLNAIQISEERIFYCFQNIRKKYFHTDGITHFSHLMIDQYCTHLYMLANYYYSETKEESLPTKLYYLSKILHSVDIYFTTQLPDIFLLVHPIGTIIGRAQFSDYFIAYQGCTVGCLNEGIFPTFKGKTIMYANSSVLGNCIIGDNVCIAANASVINKNIDDNSIVFSNGVSIYTKPNNKPIDQRPPFAYG